MKNNMARQPLKILYVSLNPEGSTDFELYRAFKANPACGIRRLPPLGSLDDGRVPALRHRVAARLKLPRDHEKLNPMLKAVASRETVDCVFIAKGNTIYPSTLRFIKKKQPRVKLVSWSQDDMHAWHNRSLYYTGCIPLYDLIITQKSYNVEELTALGANDVLFQNKAYSKTIHQPVYAAPRGCMQREVVFTGTFEEDRYWHIRYLADHGIRVHVYGPYAGRYGWQQVASTHENLIVCGRELRGKDYAAAYTNAKISLNFLRKMNRDLQTSRSMEIPACGGFMLAERTAEHVGLFKEGEEAAFFSSPGELLEKVRYYLARGEIRKQIARAGRIRCLTSAYSYDDRAAEILSVLRAY